MSRIHAGQRTWVLLLVAAVLVLAACGRAPAPSGDAGTPPVSEGPKPGGKIVVGVYSIPRQLDPQQSKSGEEYIIGRLVYEGLTTLDRNLQPVPELATEWSVGDDLRTWTFKIRPGVKFHDGLELSADDVVFSFERLLNPETGSPARANLQIIETVRAIDARTVEFRLKLPYAEFAHILGDRHVKVIPKGRSENLNQNPNGTGPFLLKEYVMGEKAVLVKNPNYWDTGLPYLDEVEIRIYPEPIVAVTSLQQGQVDILWAPPLEQIGTLKQDSRVVVEGAPTASYDVIAMHGLMAPFDNAKVRQALQYATNKAELVEAALFGYGTPTISPISPKNAMFDASLQDIQQDYATARRLLEEAGYPNGLDLLMYVPEGRPTRVRLGIAAKEMWAPAGIRVTIQQVPWDKFIADIEGKALLYTDGFFSRATVDTALYAWFHSSGSWNIYHWKNERMDELLDAARSEPDAARRKALYSEVQALIRDEAPAIIPYVLTHHDAYRTRVKGFSTHPMMWLELRSAWVEGN